MAPSEPPPPTAPLRHPSPAGGARGQKHADEVFGLWDTLNDFGKDRTDAALEHCMQRICELVDAQDAFWVGAVHVMGDAPRKESADRLLGWRMRAIRPLHGQRHDTGHYKKVVKAEVPADLEVAATNVALAAGAGRFRAYTLQGGSLVDVAAFRETAHYDFYYRRLGTADRIWVASPVNADTESYFCFDRTGDKPPFTEDDLNLAAFALRGIKWFHRQLLLSYGLGLCEEPLTPAEQRVVQALLAGGSEREIAASLQLSPATVHQYAVGIYRKFAVRGRVEFTALWLSAG